MVNLYTPGYARGSFTWSIYTPEYARGLSHDQSTLQNIPEVLHMVNLYPSICRRFVTWANYTLQDMLEITCWIYTPRYAEGHMVTLELLLSHCQSPWYTGDSFILHGMLEILLSDSKMVKIRIDASIGRRVFLLCSSCEVIASLRRVAAILNNVSHLALLS